MLLLYEHNSILDCLLTKETNFVFLQSHCELTGRYYGQKMKAYRVSAKIVKVDEATVRKWVHEFEMMEYVILESKRGKHTKSPSPILNDLEFREEFKDYVRASSREQGRI